jgi:hypothetical protein
VSAPLPFPAASSPPDSGMFWCYLLPRGAPLIICCEVFGGVGGGLVGVINPALPYSFLLIAMGLLAFALRSSFCNAIQLIMVTVTYE